MRVAGLLMLTVCGLGGWWLNSPGESAAPVFIAAAEFSSDVIENSPASTAGESWEPSFEDALGVRLSQPATSDHVLPLSEGNSIESDHWAWQPIVRPALPEVANPEWAKNPVDHLMYHWLTSQGVEPGPEITGSDWRRRAHLCITGLPAPVSTHAASVAELSAEDLVDHLLRQPEAAEHFAGFWLDLVRYADTNGYETDGRKPMAWKYRDYVIQAFAEDKPYNAFVREQLAGDLFAEATTGANNPPDTSVNGFIAAGFLRLGPWDSEPDDPLKSRFDQLDEIVRTVSEVFLGLSLNCARCHDHPSDLMTAADYYSLAGCFADLQRPVEGRQEVSTPAASNDILHRRTQVLSIQRNYYRQALQATSETVAREWRQRAHSLDAGAEVEPAYFLPAAQKKPGMFVLERGEPGMPRDPVKAVIPTVLTAVLPWQPETDANEFGNIEPRQRLAEWLTDDANALTSRLIVNRVWGWTFGKPLVANVSDFGTQTAAPEQQILLDWLADWFVRDAHWSIRQLRRLLLSSRTFRTDWQSMTPPANVIAPFPRRLSARQVRDSLLVMGGSLDKTRFGPALSSDAQSTMPSANKTCVDNRRTVYRFVKRGNPDSLLLTFDASERTVPHGRDIVTQTPQQILALLNGDLANRQLLLLAAGITNTASDFDSQLRIATQTMFAREPTREEQRVLHELYQHETQDGASCAAALHCVLRTLVCLPEFLFIP